MLKYPFSEKGGAGKDREIVGDHGVGLLRNKSFAGAHVVAGPVHHMCVREKHIGFGMRIKARLDPSQCVWQILFVAV
jgi:hypothetical protein